MLPPPAPSASRGSTATTAPPRLRLRPAGPGDLPLTARWQCAHLGHGFFPGLGRRFVARWHGAHLDAPHGVALVAELVAAEEPVPVGFLVGATDQAAHVRDVLARHRWPLLRAGAVALLTRPATAARFARTRARPYARRLLSSRRGADVVRRAAADAALAPDSGAPLAGVPVAVVSAVVVDPAARGAGVGEALLAAFCDRALAAGAPGAELVTRADGGATAFYERLGWQCVADRTSRDGARVLTYRLALGGVGAGSARGAGTAPASAPRPVDGAPVDSAPVDSAPVDSAPVEDGPVVVARAPGAVAGARGGAVSHRPGGLSARTSAA